MKLYWYVVNNKFYSVKEFELSTIIKTFWNKPGYWPIIFKKMYFSKKKCQQYCDWKNAPDIDLGGVLQIKF